MNDEMRTIKEIAEYLKIKEKTAYALVAKDGIADLKVGESWRFRKSKSNDRITAQL